VSANIGFTPGMIARNPSCDKIRSRWWQGLEFGTAPATHAFGCPSKRAPRDYPIKRTKDAYTLSVFTTIRERRTYGIQIGATITLGGWPITEID
jgi:hypothetical protein